MKVEYLGKILFEGYRISAAGTTYDGKPIPDWSELGEDVRGHWMAASVALFKAMKEHLNLDTREIEQIRHAQHYKKSFSSGGIPGHNQFLLIAKLADSLDI